MSLKLTLFAIMVFALSCAKKPEEASANGRSLYVASGTCNAGVGNTLPVPTNAVYKVNLDTGAPGEIVADYAVSPAVSPDTPTGIIDIDSDNFMVVVDNSAFRRLEKVSKASGHARTTFVNYGVLTPTGGVGRGLARSSDGSFTVGRTLQIEKFNNVGNRRTANNTSWMVASALAGTSCASSSATLYSISSLQVTPNGRTIFTNTYLNQSRIGVIKPTGYAAAADCTSAITTATTSAYPTSSLYIPDYGQLLVLFAGNSSADNNYVAVYDFDDSTGILSNEGVAFKDVSILYGGSAMTLDSDTGKIYIATANSNTTAISNSNIEKFSYDPTSRTLTRVGTTPFATSWMGSKCISSMFVGN